MSVFPSTFGVKKSVASHSIFSQQKEPVDKEQLQSEHASKHAREHCKRSAFSLFSSTTARGCLSGDHINKFFWQELYFLPEPSKKIKEKLKIRVHVNAVYIRLTTVLYCHGQTTNMFQYTCLQAVHTLQQNHDFTFGAEPSGVLRVGVGFGSEETNT